MVRRGSTVRVRQRAFEKALQMGLCVVCLDAAPASRGYETGTFSDERALAGTRGLARPTSGLANSASVNRKYLQTEHLVVELSPRRPPPSLERRSRTRPRIPDPPAELPTKRTARHPWDGAFYGARQALNGKPTSYATSWDLTECRRSSFPRDSELLTRSRIRPLVGLAAERQGKHAARRGRPRRQEKRVCAASCTDAGTSRGRPGSTVASTAESHAAAAARANSVT